MNLFYAEPELIAGSSLILEGPEFHHAFKVLRMQRGDVIRLTDGKGIIYSGVVAGVEKRSARIEIEEKREGADLRPRYSVAVGNIRQRSRIEFAIEKAVELGVRQFLLFNGDHSEKGGVKLERLHTAALSAMKQSLRSWLPGVRHCDSLERLLDESPFAPVYMADETLDMAADPIRSEQEQDEPLLVIGPEGGFSEMERALLKARKAKGFSLGCARLRTETAVLAALCKFNTNAEASQDH
ncbi:MAG: RsmE family RNA methyltransferase [Balneolaceae bacterium]